ncbi:hypothetical protein HDZ31DRAFT_28359 [Schizophyllum fasciatum]
MTDTLPSSPQAWRLWADSAPLKDIPAKTSQGIVAMSSISHDVYVDLSTVKMDSADLTFVYTDVLALSPAPTVSLSLPRFASINLFARAITSEAPVNLELSTADDEMAQLVIWATYVDQPVTVTLANKTQPAKLDLGPGSGNVGVSIIAYKGQLTVSYMKEYDVQDVDADGDLAKLLATQLRIASVLFWIQPLVAFAMTWHVVRTTHLSYSCASLNVQASAIQQQIRAAWLAGPGTTYAPVLKLDYYKGAMITVLDAGAAFQQQYDRFVDRGATVDDQLKVWDSMLVQAENTVTMQQRLATDAKAKWVTAQQILRTAKDDMRRHQITLANKEAAFKAGLQTWQREQIVKAVFDIFMAVVSFAVSIGAVCVGDPGPAAEAPAQAAQAVAQVAEAAEAAAKVTEKLVKKSTLENIEKVIEVLSKTLESTLSFASAVDDAASGSATLSPFPPSPDGDEDLQALVGVAAWDQWTLEAEDQMSFAVDEGIGGASDYLLELRKQAIDGKLTTQASAQAVKAGQECVQQQLALQLAQADIARLQKLRATFKGEESELDVARLHFYDRLDAMRTSTLIELRNIIWAFKFYTLTDSSLTLSPLKRMEDYKADLAELVREIESYEESYASDKSPIHFIRSVQDACIPINERASFNGIGAELIASLKQNRVVTFALAPRPAGKAVLPFPAGPFVGGSGFRVSGMRVFLQGAVPKAEALSSDGSALVSLAIGTSGVYADVRQDGTVLGFTSMPLVRQFKYRVSAQGATVANGIEVDSIIPLGQHMDPPPFAQWSITVVGSDIDLANLTDIQLEWQGAAYITA